MAENHGELERFGGEPAPSITKEQFDQLPQAETIPIGEVGAIPTPFGTLVNRLKNWKANAVKTFFHKEIPWKPEDKIERSRYQGVGQEDLSDYEYSCAQDFLGKLNEYKKVWPKEKMGTLPIKQLSPDGNGEVRAVGNRPGQGWGFDFLRENYGDEVVDTYFKNLKLNYYPDLIKDDYVYFEESKTERGDESKGLLSKILFSEKTSLENLFGKLPKNAGGKEWGDLNQGRRQDLDMLAKQYIYFLRFAEGNPGKQIQPPIVEKLKRGEE